MWAYIRFRGRDSCFGGKFINLYRQERQVRKVGVACVTKARRQANPAGATEARKRPHQHF
jgi:hypothetical protein